MQPEAWHPEVVIDFDRWFELKAWAEQMLIEGDTPPGEPVVVWSPDSTYAVIMEDRARAPNLAAVREIGFAVYNAGGAPVSGAVWIDELRLGGAVTDPGLAGHVGIDLRAGSFATASVAYANRGAGFRLLNQTPGYQTTRDMTAVGTVHLGTLAPESWALDAPVTVSYSRSGLEPTFLPESDVRANRLPGLRRTGSRRTHVGFALRRTRSFENPVAGFLLDGAAVRVDYRTAANASLTTEDRSEGVEAAVGWTRTPEPRDVDVVPAPVEAAPAPSPRARSRRPTRSAASPRCGCAGRPSSSR